MALIIPTAAKMVSTYETHSWIAPIPHRPQKQFIDELFAYINQATIIISIKKRMLGDRPMMSSVVPIYSITSIAAIKMNVWVLLNIAGEQQSPMAIPKNTATPPRTGTGLR